MAWRQLLEKGGSSAKQMVSATSLYGLGRAIVLKQLDAGIVLNRLKRRCMSSYTSNFSRRLEQLEREGGPDAQEKQVKFLRDLNEVDPEGRPLPQRSASALAEYLKALVKVDRLDDSALLKTLQRGATASLGSFQAEARPIMSSAFPAVGTATKDGILGSPSAPIHMVTSEGGFRVQVWRTVRTLALGFLLLSGVGAIVKDKGLSKGKHRRAWLAMQRLERRCWLGQLLVKQGYRFSIAAGASSRKCSSDVVLGECGTYSQALAMHNLHGRN